jgi:ATP synthase F1 delta subunit
LKQVKNAKKYAKTLINIVGLDAVPGALTELTIIEQLMSKNGDFRNLLVNPSFSQTERKNALEQVASKAQLSDKMLQFIVHLTDTKVIVGLSQIIRTATTIYMEKKKQAKATVLSPVKLSEGHEERLRASLRQMIKKEVEVDFQLDETLLGGVLVKVGSTMYDSSIKGQLRLLKDELIKG